MRAATSSRLSTSSAIFMRRSLPNWFINTRLPGYPFTVSNSNAGPPGAPFAPCLRYPGRPHFDTRSVISAISRIGSPARGWALTRLLYPAP